MNDLPTLDMDAVTREALGGVKTRAWSMEYLCHGKIFKWAGYAHTQQAADKLARESLDEFADFTPADAKLTVAVEV